MTGIRSSTKEPTVLEIAPFLVSTNGFEVAEFSRELLGRHAENDNAQSVPFTFPVRWFSIPPVREYLAAACGMHSIFLMRQEFEYKEPLGIDRNYFSSLNLIKQTIMQIIQLKGIVRDEQDRPVATIKSVLQVVAPTSESLRKKAARRVASNQNASSIVIGPIQQSWISRYAAVSFDDNPVHIDHQFALEQGLPNTVVHGSYLTEILSHALGQWYPGSEIKRLSTNFLRPVFEGSSIRIAARILEEKLIGNLADRLIRLTLQLDDGEMVAVAEANVLADNV